MNGTATIEGMAELRIFNVPGAIHRSLKVAAAQAGTTLNAYVIELLKAATVDKARRGK